MRKHWRIIKKIIWKKLRKMKQMQGRQQRLWQKDVSILYLQKRRRGERYWRFS